MPELIIGVLVVGALALLVVTLLSSERYGDPSSSVEDFNRALSAIAQRDDTSADDSSREDANKT